MRTIIFFAREFTWNSAPTAENDTPQSETMKDTVVVFLHAESGDDDPKKRTIGRFLKQVKQIARKWETKNIVLYPFSHLGEEKAEMDVANALMDETAARLIKVGYNTACTAFGRFIDFKMDSPGAPLSRAFRQF